MRIFGASVAGLLAAALVAVAGEVWRASARELLHAVSMMLLAGSPFAAIGALIGWKLIRKDVASAWTFGLGGASLVLITGVQSLTLAAAGAAGGLVFWWFAVKLRPAWAEMTCFVAVAIVGSAAVIQRVPDLPVAEAAALLSRSPEFQQHGRLVKVDGVDHMKDSMDSLSYGRFTLQHDGELLKGRADFRHSRGKWNLNQFDYGCPGPPCQRVNINWINPGE